MVTAGVYLLVRVNPILAAAAEWLPQLDRVGAGCSPRSSPPPSPSPRPTSRRCWPTRRSSQLGYMFLAVGHGRVRRRHLPHDHPRLLQGPHVPRGGLGHPRDARRAGHAPHGRAPQGDAHHRGHLRHRRARHLRRAPLLRLLVQGRDPLLRPARQPGPLPDRPPHRRPHRVLHLPTGVHDVLRRCPMGRVHRGRARGQGSSQGPRRRRRRRRRRGPRCRRRGGRRRGRDRGPPRCRSRGHPPRVAVAHDRPTDRARLRCGLRRLHQPSVLVDHRVPHQLPRAGDRGQRDDLRPQHRQAPRRAHDLHDRRPDRHHDRLLRVPQAQGRSSPHRAAVVRSRVVHRQLDHELRRWAPVASSGTWPPSSIAS